MVHTASPTQPKLQLDKATLKMQNCLYLLYFILYLQLALAYTITYLTQQKKKKPQSVQLLYYKDKSRLLGSDNVILLKRF